MSIEAGQTAEASDFITAAQADPTPANNAGKVPKLEANGKLSNDFLDLDSLFVVNKEVIESIDGTTTPQAVHIAASGKLVRAEADVSGRQGFFGFVKTNNTVVTPAIVSTSYGADISTGITGFVAQAGVSRVGIAIVLLDLAGGITPTLPSGVTWGGNAMTLITSGTRQDAAVAAYWIALGTNASNDAAVNIVVSGASAGIGNSVSAIVYDHVNQSDAIGGANTATGSGTSFSVSATIENGSSRVVNILAWNSGTFTAWGQGQTNLATLNANFARISHMVMGAIATGSQNFTAGSGTTGAFAIAAFELNTASASAVSASVILAGQCDGFSGLTPGAKYYVSNTTGAIATTPGTQTIPVGKAISATTLFITD
jgi:hypothetical protein